MRASFDGKIAPIVNELACILPRSLVAGAILFLSAGSVATFRHAKEKQPSSCVFHVLFLGNSYTYFNNLPGILYLFTV